ncbi:hypothetical protein [Pseudomonas sp. 18175]|uniref:hypothetical protein n=1 Tax=Pseudomonas sp. 18175 TaxID=3390056 RepID=UPI003D19CFC9
MYKTTHINIGLASAVVVSVITGCTGPEFRKLQVFSVPAGATIREDGEGSVPPKVSYLEALYRSSNLEKNMANGCFLLTGYTATWPSGAKASTGTIRWCNTQYPQMAVYIDRPKGAPNLALDNKTNEEREARQKIEYERQQQQRLAEIEARYAGSNTGIERSNENEEESGDEDIGMAGALGAIATTYSNIQASQKIGKNNRVAVPSTQQDNRAFSSSQALARQQALASNQASGTAQLTSANSNRGNASFDYDVSHSQCVTYGRHPTLKAYAQYKNTCPYSVSVTYCSVLKNGRDNCASRIFGSFQLKPGGTNISEGSDTSVKYLACKLPYQAIGANVTVSGDQMSAPCQKNK